MNCKQVNKVSLLVFLFIIGIQLNAQLILESRNFSKLQIELISDYLLKFPDKTQISIALVNDSAIKYFGVEKIDEKVNTIDNENSIFEKGSITKVFTATMLSKFVLDSVISLNDDISGILPYQLNQISKENKSITYKTLANHTSGLDFEPDNIGLSIEKNPKNPYLNYSYKLFDNYLQHSMVINTEPGSNYQYSNLGFGFLGYLLERTSGKDYETLFQEIVCDKYNLQNSSTKKIDNSNLRVEGLDTLGRVLPHWDCNSLNASGGVMSNTIDLSNFIISNFNRDSVLNLQRQVTFKNMNNHTALGWEVFEVGGGKCSMNWHYKTGGMGGFSSVIIMDTDTKFGLSILSNISAYHKNENTLQLAVELLKSMYIAAASEELGVCEAPFLELALDKGWGTWGKSVNDSLFQVKSVGKSILGIWQKQSNSRSHLGINSDTRTFMLDGKVQSDFTGNPEIDVWGYYYLKDNQIELEDIGGNACKNNGIYNYSIQNDTLIFQTVNDNCDGRLMGLSGIWVRKN